MQSLSVTGQLWTLIIRSIKFSKNNLKNTASSLCQALSIHQIFRSSCNSPCICLVLCLVLTYATAILGVLAFSLPHSCYSNAKNDRFYFTCKLYPEKLCSWRITEEFEKWGYVKIWYILRNSIVNILLTEMSGPAIDFTKLYSKITRVRLLSWNRSCYQYFTVLRWIPAFFYTFISAVGKVLSLAEKVVNKSSLLLNYLQRSQWWHPSKSISLLVNREKPENSSTSKIVNNFRKNTFFHWYFRRM